MSWANHERTNLAGQTLWAAVRINEGTGAEEATVVRAGTEVVPGAVGSSATDIQAVRAEN